MSASKREELVEKALDVFYREGFHATGMDRLVTETGISKTSMYNHFRTKEELILATLELRHKRFSEKLMADVKELASTPDGQLLAIFDALKIWFSDPTFKSCMFIKASSEYQDNSHPIHKVAAKHKQAFQDYMKDLAEQAGLANPAELAAQLQLLQEGAIVLAHLQGPASFAEHAKAAAQALIEKARPVPQA